MPLLTEELNNTHCVWETAGSKESIVKFGSKGECEQYINVRETIGLSDSVVLEIREIDSSDPRLT